MADGMGGEEDLTKKNDSKKIMVFFTYYCAMLWGVGTDDDLLYIVMPVKKCTNS